MFTSTFIKRFIHLSLLMVALAACTDSIEPVVQADQTVTKLPTTTVTAVSTSAPLPVTPTPVADVDTWSHYHNAFYAYAVSYPPEAKIDARGAEFVSSDLVPADLTDDEFLAQINATYPDNICLTILYKQGFVAILAPRDNGGQFIGICGIGGLGVYDFSEKEEELIIDGHPYIASGSELREQTSEQTFHGGYFSLTLADGTMITYGTTDLLATASGLWEVLAYEDYLALIETLQQIVSSYRSSGTATTPTLPQSSEEALLTPLVSLMVQNEPVAGTVLSYGFTDGQELGAYETSHLNGVELASAKFSAGEPITLVAYSTAVSALEAQITGDIYPSERAIQYLPAMGETVGETAVFTLEQSGYNAGQYLRVRLNLEEPVPGTAEYLWQLVPGSDSQPAMQTVEMFETAVSPCAIPTSVTAATATPAAESDWAEILQMTAPETFASLADLIVMGTIDEPIEVAQNPMRTSHMGLPTIHTFTTVAVECTLKGNLATPTLTLRTFGGCIEDACQVDISEPLVVGQRAVLFLRHEGPEYATLRQTDGSYTLFTRPSYFSLVSREDAFYKVEGDTATATARHSYSLAELLLRIATAAP